MKPSFVSGLSILPILTGGLILALPAAAQSLLYVVQAERMLPVRKMANDRPLIMKDGKLVTVIAHRYALAPAVEFFPVFVSVRNLHVGGWQDLVGANTRLNNELHLRAEFESAFRLEDVFLVVDLNTREAGKTMFVHEVGTLESRVARQFEMQIPTRGEIGSGRYEIHLFVKGIEVFHSEQPFAFRQAALDKMVAKRLENVRDGAPKPFIAPPPEYPTVLRQANLKGQAVVSLRIAANGAVFDPVVEETSHPAFGEAALVAVRLWRFLPKVKEGRAVETRASVPFDFDPSPH